jgi:hypothetical protein
MRCALDHQRLGPGDTAEQGGYLVHVANGKAVLPLHEVIEGRLLRGGTGDEPVSGPVEQPTMPIAERRVDEP